MQKAEIKRQKFGETLDTYMRKKRLPKSMVWAGFIACVVIAIADFFKKLKQLVRGKDTV
ncbi:MAG: hypothetical protein H7647_09705, partial [Candidatus Heimdallarchaeota archaeon]|nr:hypothetical protein [Candidatus Heimdallarchaeota archaeon]